MNPGQQHPVVTPSREGVIQGAADRQGVSVLYRPALQDFAWVLTALTLALLALGGTVTSKGVGLSVPDWPTTYNYNMFLFPPSMWQGGIFWEHTHRLWASGVGFLTIILAVWLWITQASRPWLRILGIFALVLVIVQGIMGGFRVTFVNHWPSLATPLAVAHGITGQLFLCVLLVIAMATGRWWIQRTASAAEICHSVSRSLRLATTCLIIALLVQLSLGAMIRHYGAGIAIPDFPTSYGHIIPPLTNDGIRAAMDEIPYDQGPHAYYTVAQVGVNFAHRVWALIVIAAAVVVIAKASLAFPDEGAIRRPLIFLAGLLIAQVALGATVIWTGRHPEIATAHQATGALVLATAVYIAIRVRIVSRYGVVSNPSSDPAHSSTPNGAITLGGVKA
ncbi:MAG: COX15/CtaA family protein [Phycisphaeraceae bacterium]|nr:COX15/CtaA family protein [Phycisphaeraceae bacterium]